MQVVCECAVQSALEQDPCLFQAVPRREENGLARQRVAEDLWEIERFGELERALEVWSGEVVLCVEDEEASELRRDGGDVFIRVLPSSSASAVSSRSRLVEDDLLGSRSRQGRPRRVQPAS